MNRVLLLGGTGAVGKGCLDVLARREDTSLVLAGRDESRLREVASAMPGDVETVRLDATDAAAVTAAAGHCDILINCAGPSHLLSANVAGAAVAARVPYVDPGGDQALLDRLAAQAPPVPVVLQAGVQPGLSGLLLRALAENRPGGIDGVTAWCGGLQPLTPASVLEYVASLRDSHGHPGAALRDGVIRRVGHDEIRPAPPEYFPGSVSLRPHLDAETLAVAEYLGIGNVLWLNVFDGVHTTRAMQLVAVGDHDARGRFDLDDVLAAVKLDLFGRRPYFAIVGNAGSTTLAFTCPDSFRVTGAVAAYAAENLASMPAGVHPFWSVDEPHRVVDFLTGVVPGARASLVDDALIEEGSL